MKKTLLVAAATLAVGTFASQAQVYSQNIVGYVNVTVPNTGYALVGNQLVNGSDSEATNNDIQTVLSSGGYVSDPAGGGACTTLNLWNGSTFIQYQYFNATDAANNTAGTTAGWYDSSGNYVVGASLGQGQGAFIYNNVSTNINITLIGTVPQGTNIQAIVPGYNLVSVVYPIAEDITSLSFVGTSDPAGGGDCSTLDAWNGTTYVSYQYYNATDAANNTSGSTAGWYDSSGNYAVVKPAVGSAFFIYQPANGGSFNWTNSFTVN